MLTIDVIFDQGTRQVSFPRDYDMYGGATIDSESVEISVSGIDMGYTSGLSVRLDFAVQVQVEDNVLRNPFLPLTYDGQGHWTAVIPRVILSAAARTRKLPFQLVIRDADRVINSRNTLTLDITRAIDATDELEDEYTPYLMYRGESWSWVEDVSYSEGAVVTHAGYLFISRKDGNIGNVPQVIGDDPYWRINIRGGTVVVRVIGNGVDTEYDVVHDLDTLAPSYVLQRDGEYVYTTVKVVDEDTLKVIFKTPPEQNSILMTIMATNM